MTTPKPDFLLVGAPKCGTATLSDWLAQHPDIFLMDPREPNFFGSDLTMLRHFDSSEGYRRQFDEHARQVCGEGTTWYLYSESAPEEIFRFNPKTKILMILRNPVELVQSLHNFRLYYGDESEHDLGRVLDREHDALKRWSTTGEPKDVLKIYLDVARYSAGVERYLSRFGPDQTKILLFDDLKVRPEQLVKEIFQFLGVADFRPELRRQNEAQQHRIKFLGPLLLRPGQTFGAITKHLPQSWRRKIGAALRQANTRKGRDPSLAPQLEKRIIDEVRSDVARLESLLGQKLPGWA